MGNFYTNISLKGPSQNQILAVLRELGRTALVTPAVDHFTVVYDKECENQDIDLLASLNLTLTHHLQCAGCAALNHDDDVLWLSVFENGQPAGEYDSNTRFTQRKERATDAKRVAANLSRIFSPQSGIAGVTRVEQILARRRGWLGYRFEIDRHRDLLQALHLPLFALAAGYNYVTRGEFPEGLSAAELARV